MFGANYVQYICLQAPVLEKHSPKKLADVFAEDSEDDGTFYGFSDTEIKNGVFVFIYIDNDDTRYISW